MLFGCRVRAVTTGFHGGLQLRNACLSLLPVEIVAGLRRTRVELDSVVARRVEKLPVIVVAIVVVLGIFHTEIGDPSQFTKHVSLLSQFGVVRHPGSLHFIFLVGVKLAHWLERDVFSPSERLVKEFLQNEKVKATYLVVAFVLIIEG